MIPLLLFLLKQMQPRIPWCLRRTWRCEPRLDPDSFWRKILWKDGSPEASLTASGSCFWLLLWSRKSGRRNLSRNLRIHRCNSLRCRNSDASSGLQLHDLLYGSEARGTASISNLSRSLSQESSVFLQIYWQERTTSQTGVYGLRSLLRGITVSFTTIHFLDSLLFEISFLCSVSLLFWFLTRQMSCLLLIGYTHVFHVWAWNGHFTCSSISLPLFNVSSKRRMYVDLHPFPALLSFLFNPYRRIK